MTANRQSWVSGLQLPVRAGVAAGLAVIAASLLHLRFPLYAMIGAIIVTELSSAETRRLGKSRLLATIVGAAIGALLAMSSQAGPVMIALGTAGAMFLMHGLGLAGGARVAGYVCGIVLLEHHDSAWTYAGLRVIETVHGIAAALLVSVVPKLLKAES